mmetsp:Transcript_17157/g.23579  ORF Transcript_17157/g.23579 Transcript_17157/m.23579 type:complete len:83 (+) Transcript_17157:1250-1498(+)
MIQLHLQSSRIQPGDSYLNRGQISVQRGITSFEIQKELVGRTLIASHRQIILSYRVTLQTSLRHPSPLAMTPRRGKNGWRSR